MIELKKVTWEEYREYLGVVDKKDHPVTSWLYRGRNIRKSNPYDKSDIFYVLMDKGLPVATCNINVDTYRNTIWLGDYQVFNKYRGEGYGTCMLNKLRKLYSDMQFTLSSLPGAKTFWKNRGFVQTYPWSNLMELDPLIKTKR